MGSNCNSLGIPIDHDGHQLEDFIHDAAPIAISGAVFQELMFGKLNDLKGNHLESEPVGGSSVQKSSSGGFLIWILEDVLVEDYYSSDEHTSTRSAKGGCGNSTSDTVHAVLRTSKHERDALY